MLQISYQNEADFTVVTLDGHLVAAHCENLRLKIKNLLAGDTKNIRIEIAGVTAIDSAGIGLLAAIHNSLQKAGGSLVVCNPSKDMYQFLIKLRLNNHFTIQKSGEG